ncbi:MAG: sigma-70 family RNA polymerase sigma factor [Deltaproteobacteria bacterium]|nr:sigma-70 family RNA polymerase sigma factor [Deltaproteobacteria bacterium]
MARWHNGAMVMHVAGDEAGLTDSALLAQARDGDARALESLLARHQAQIYRFGLKMCRDPEDAKDVLQDTLLAFARGVREYRGESSLSTWLYSVARSYCVKKHRKSKYAPAHESSLEREAAVEVSQVADDARGPDETLAGTEVERAFALSMSELEPMYREVLVLRDIEGLTAPEVATVLGVSVQAVKSRLHRARGMLREHIAPRLGITEDLPAALGTCPDVLTLFSQHLEDEISATVCADMERHLKVCARCRGACDSLRKTLSLCRTTGSAVEVPPDVQAAVKSALRMFISESP